MSTKMTINGKTYDYIRDPKVSSVELPAPVPGTMQIGGIRSHFGIFYKEMDNVPDTWIDQSGICHLLSCTEEELAPLIKKGYLDCGEHKITNIRYYLVKEYQVVLDHFKQLRERENAKKRNKQKAVHGRPNDTGGIAPKASNSSYGKVQWMRR